MNFPIPQQAAFFYRGKWNREMDTLLLSTMVNMRGGWEWDDDCGTDEVLRGVINPPFGAKLSTEDISIRVKLLKTRYMTFKKAYWNMKDKVVVATSRHERDVLAGAYLTPEFCLLASFFGLFDVKDEFPHEVITLSDNTEVIVLSDSLVPDAPIRGMRYDSPADSNEVTSPMSDPSTRVRRKLFDVGGPCFDEASSTKSPTRFNPPKEEILGSPKGSSCAAWSPCPISRKTARNGTV
ncbi:hypothetical protein SASPL_102886 [Salvia splendens]|uniref:Myb/SANT-like domain-containing protein n=1 Tax=Salvia splendens TaxID=180675 RepID=A0A8X8YS45_SALSN|nr:hypothetical protein SASPL_102886 [Salvia splendens]